MEIINRSNQLSPFIIRHSLIFRRNQPCQNRSSPPPLRDLFKFPFQSDNWRNNFIVGTVLILASFWIPIIPLIFVFGYLAPIMRQGIEGQDLALPPWTDWGRLGQDGSRMLLVGVTYLLPSLIIFIGGFLLYFATFMAFPFMMGSSGPDLESGEGLGLFLTLIFGGL